MSPPPDPPNPDPTDDEHDLLFDQLLEASWRDVPFPVTKMKVSLAHDLVEHKYWGVDGASVENTGAAPWRYSFSAPFINGLSNSGAETWDHRLYPDHLRKFLEAFQDKSVGQLQHPEFGLIFAKAERLDIDWDGGRRGGVEVEMSFVETNVEGQTAHLDASPIDKIDAAAGELNSIINKADFAALLKKQGLEPPPYLSDPTFSFEEAMNKIKAVTDYPTLLSMRAGGRIDAVIFQAERVAKSAEAARSAVTWPITQNVERVKAAAYNLRESLLATRSRRIAFFTVPADTTIAGVARQLPSGAKMGDVIKLNPGLMLNPEVSRGTVVRYYAD